MKRAILCLTAFAAVCTVATAQDTDKHKNSVEPIAIHQKADVTAPANGTTGATASTGTVQSKGIGPSSAKNINTSEDNLGTGKGSTAVHGSTGVVKSKDTSTGSSAKNINTSEDNLGTGKGSTTVHGATGTTTSTTPPAANVKPVSEHGSGLATGK